MICSTAVFFFWRTCANCAKFASSAIMLLLEHNDPLLVMQKKNGNLLLCLKKNVFESVFKFHFMSFMYAPMLIYWALDRLCIMFHDNILVMFFYSLCPEQYASYVFARVFQETWRLSFKRSLQKSSKSFFAFIDENFIAISRTGVG